jgi:hypothetical protein
MHVQGESEREKLAYAIMVTDKFKFFRISQEAGDPGKC